MDSFPHKKPGMQIASRGVDRFMVDAQMFDSTI